jgi:hypothetical protein
MADQNAENVLVPSVRYGWDKKFRLEILVLLPYISSGGIPYMLNGESTLLAFVHGYSNSGRRVHRNGEVNSPAAFLPPGIILRSFETLRS